MMLLAGRSGVLLLLSTLRMQTEAPLHLILGESQFRRKVVNGARLGTLQLLIQGHTAKFL